MGLDISTHFQHGRSGKFDVPIYSKDLLVCCVSSLITFDTNLNICVYFSLVCTRLFNKKKLTQHVQANLTEQRMLCVPQMTFLCFLTGRSLLGRDVFYPEVIILSFRFCETSGYRVTVCYVINEKEFHTTEVDI